MFCPCESKYESFGQAGVGLSGLDVLIMNPGICAITQLYDAEHLAIAGDPV
jgi:hypothetical protein